jgi:unsaturated rhamnogalacturonyl hydrolase
MNKLRRRDIVKMCLALPFTSRMAVASRWLGEATTTNSGEPFDWSKAVVANAMHRQPDPAKLGRWGYAIALYLYGQYLVYQRSHDTKYLDYIQGWVDSNVDDKGAINNKLNALDDMLAGNLLLILYKETGQQRYKTAAESIRNRFGTFPRTEDGGLWHATSRQHQLWLDGMYMSMPFLVRYGAAMNDQPYACDEAVKQLLIYARHLNDPVTGLLFHAYDESGKQAWADPVTHHSPIKWCRAIGWYGMALIEVLEILPKHHAQRTDLIKLVKQLATAYAKYQDPATGLWYQVVDQPMTPGNWLETSSSCMYTYTLSRAVERGYIAGRFTKVASKGYAGVLTQLTQDENGLAHITNICEGTNVGDLAFYLARPRSTDDFHGIGAFLIMNEQLRQHRG